jgi:hypothetical protein
MKRKILSISAVSNPADQSPGTLEGEILPAELPPVLTSSDISRAINALHDQGTRTGSRQLCALALRAGIQHQALKSFVTQFSTRINRNFNNA